LQLDLAEVPPVRGHEGEFIQVFTNLVINACEALADGGTVRLSTRYDGRHVLATVQDDGPGMTAETRQSLFERHFTTKHGDNSGLGLSIVADIVRRHGGHVLVNSEPGCGTSFYVSLHPDLTAAVPLRRPTFPLRVLLVDDEPAIRQSLQEILTREGHTVRAAGTAEAALALMDKPFDLLLTDLNLGSGEDGFALAREARRRQPAAKVLVATAWHEGKPPPEVDMLLHKPVKSQQLLAAVQHLTRPGPDTAARRLPVRAAGSAGQAAALG
jgi:CheY-like chemotaxis protein